MKVNEITKESLMAHAIKHGYTDHVQHFEELFKLFKNKKFIECGVGYSTKYFLDNCSNVTSIEFVNNGFGGWMNEMVELFKDCNNWKPINYSGSEKLHSAEHYRAAQRKDPELIDGAYIAELKELFQKEASGFDIAFVDSGVYIRGDFVEQFLQMNIPVVVAHDLNPEDPYSISQYGWEKIKSTGDYENIHFSNGNSTSFWIRKDLKKVIAGMKKYKNSL